jgi:hypothetical protein
MITHDARRSLSRGNNPVPSPWLATLRLLVLSRAQNLTSATCLSAKTPHDQGLS